MKTVLIAPRRYVQGRGVLNELGPYAAILGKKALVLWDRGVRQIVGATALESLKGAGVEVIDCEFQGETTKEESTRIADLVRSTGAEMIIAVGGGKTLDAGKASAIWTGVKMVTVPTIASTDSPCSAATVWYDAAGNCTGFECWPANPDLVLVDSLVIASAPVRSFVAGMGDALSTCVEAEAGFKARALNLAGGVATQAAMGLARLCHETLMKYGVEAKRAVEQKVVTPAVEKVIEANVLLSGLGFESGCVATAHAIANALPSFPECKKFMHGEKVGFGVVSQLCLDEDFDVDEMYAIVDFEIAVGLPVTLADLDLGGISRKRLMQIGEICTVKGGLCENHPFEVTADSVVDAMFAADALGKARKAAFDLE